MGTTYADPIGTILSNVLDGNRLSDEEALTLFRATGRDVIRIAAAADEMRERAVGDAVTYVANQNVNVTNICVNSCGFCGFCRKEGDDGVYFYGKEEIQARSRLALERKVTEICTVSGLHPDFTADSYIDAYRWIKEAAPGVHLHASNPMEVAYAAKKSGISTREVIVAMQAAGLNSMCGTAAEILVDEIRRKICPGKIPTDEWIRIIKEVHETGLPTTATIMYGHCEQDTDWVTHLRILREIQEETHGFTEFVPLSFIHMATPLFKKGEARAGATGREDLLMIAVSRLYLDNFRNFQVSWVKEGVKFAQIALLAGANDLGGTVFEERISKGAGAQNTDYLAPSDMLRIAQDIGRPLQRRNTLYQILPD